MGDRKFELKNLIEKMINADPTKRPTAQELMNHVFFWNSEKKLNMIQELSDRLEYKKEEKNFKTQLIVELERIGKSYKIFDFCN